MEYARALLEGRFKRMSLEKEIADANETLLYKSKGYQIKFQSSAFFRSLKFEMLAYKQDLVKQDFIKYKICRYGYKLPYRIDFENSMVELCTNYIHDNNEYNQVMTEALVYLFDFYRAGEQPLTLEQNICSFIRSINLNKMEQGVFKKEESKENIRSKVFKRFNIEDRKGNLQEDTMFNEIYMRCIRDMTPIKY